MTFSGSPSLKAENFTSLSVIEMPYHCRVRLDLLSILSLFPEELWSN
jgi:hypothetical protein